MQFSSNQKELIIKLRDNSAVIESELVQQGKRSKPVMIITKDNGEKIDDISQATNTVNALINSKILVAEEKQGKFIYRLNNKKLTLIDAL